MKRENLETFWNIIKPEKKNEYVEIRLTPTWSKQDWLKTRYFYKNIEELKQTYKDVLYNKSVCWFVQDFETFYNIISFNEGYFSKHCKICYGINTRVQNKDKTINGSYECVKEYRFLFFDIEAADHGEIKSEFYKKIFDEEYIPTVIKYLETFNLYDPTIINSGVGKHLLYKIKRQNVTPKRKQWLKEFMNELSKALSNDTFIIDALSDATRIFGMPETMNIKRNKKVEVVKYSNVISEFKIKSKRIEKVKYEPVENLPPITKSLEWNVLIKSDVPQGDRHRILIFALKLLLKAHNVTNVSQYEKKLREIYGMSVSLNPSNGTTDKTYSKGIILNWCKLHYDWLSKYPDLIKIRSDMFDL